MFTRGGAIIPRIFLGCAEAEGEATNERMPILEIYEDYQEIAHQLDHEKFVLIGRKGSGKSAFGTYVCEYAKGSPTMFARFIRKHDYDLELITRGAREAGVSFNAAAFLKWLVLTNIIKLFLTNEAAKASKKFVLLEQFLNKNSGYVEINRSSVVEEIKKHELKISTEFFKRFLKNSYGRTLDIKEERAHYTRLLPHLELVVKEILNSKLVTENENSFTLFFDDLDLGYTGNEASKTALVELLRTARNLNIETFSGTKAKVVILLRDDIEAQLSDFADTGKLLNSYGYKITWIRERELSRETESDIPLKRLINKRIAHACKIAGLMCRQDDPWESLVSYSPSNNLKTTFRDVLEYTLFRPRDLIVFFSPLNGSDYQMPLSYRDVNKLKEEYGRSLFTELKNEMAASYSSDEVNKIVRALAGLKVESYGDFSKKLAQEMPSCDTEAVMNYLYSRSMIGNIDAKGHFWFSCRSVAGAKGHSIDPTLDVTLQIALKSHLSN